MEADIYPKEHPERADAIDGNLGEGSPFHIAWGYYAHGIGPETAHAPAGWEERMLKVHMPPLLSGGEPPTAWFMEVHDLALSKLAAGREKDVDYVIEALAANIVDAGQLRLGLPLMPEADRQRASSLLDVAIGRAEQHRQVNDTPS